METNGILINKERVEFIRDLCATERTTLADDIYANAGREFNIDYFGSLAEYLYQDLAIPLKPNYMTPKGKPGASKQILDQIVEDLKPGDLKRDKVLQIIDFKKNAKMLNTFCPGLVAGVREDGRNYPDIGVGFVTTGRYSCGLWHQLPSYEIKEGRPETNIRSAIVAAPGHKLISADYSQIELRVLAHCSEDPNMIAAFNSDVDYHQQTADLVNNSGFSITRQQAKIINFAILFGGTSYLVAKLIGSSNHEADKILKAYYKVFSGIVGLREKTMEIAHKNKEIYTLGGYKYNLSGQKIFEGGVMSHLIQGGAAVVMKKAMANVYRALLKDHLLEENRVRILLTFHDELVFEVDEYCLEHAVQIIKGEMESCMKLLVPLKVGIGIGDDYASCK